jgi:hypothetical protein
VLYSLALILLNWPLASRAILRRLSNGPKIRSFFPPFLFRLPYAPLSIFRGSLALGLLVLQVEPATEVSGVGHKGTVLGVCYSLVPRYLMTETEAIPIGNEDDGGLIVA